uniref:Uncharacterized protein n=1 Tax=Brassica campestris TaxID=3711 RepID=A0A3P6CBR5_BRACM|nr:unnamed protein product [Brassica rapa]
MAPAITMDGTLTTWRFRRLEFTLSAPRRISRSSSG